MHSKGRVPSHRIDSLKGDENLIHRALNAHEKTRRAVAHIVGGRVALHFAIGRTLENTVLVEIRR